MVAGAVDIGLSGGPEMAFTAKGSPQIAIATIVDSPTFMGISVANNSPARGIDDLKGKKIGVTSPGSLTYWLVEELSRAKGWTNERDRATPVVIGGNPAAQYAALRTGSVDATLGGVSVGYQLEVQKEGRLLIPVSEYVKDICAVRDLRLDGDHPAESRRGAAFPQGLVRFGRLHEEPQGRDRGARDCR